MRSATAGVNSVRRISTNATGPVPARRSPGYPPERSTAAMSLFVSPPGGEPQDFHLTLGQPGRAVAAAGNGVAGHGQDGSHGVVVEAADLHLGAQLGRGRSPPATPTSPPP